MSGFRMNEVVFGARAADPVNPSYRAYCRVAAVAFADITIYGLAVNIVRQHLPHDWFHSVLHLSSAAFAAYAGWMAADVILARLFTQTIGILYLALGIDGWFTPGLFMNSPLAIPLSAGDNAVHLLLSGPALAIVIRDLVTRRSSGAPMPQ